MSRRPDSSKRRRVLGHGILGRLGTVGLCAVGIVVGSATMAAAYFTLTSLGTGAAQAGAIAAPTGFTATSSFPNQATLSWTAPSDPSPTGYVLTGPIGTGSTCTSTPGASTASCLVKGLTQGTAYTWTLVAKDHTWSSPAVTATATTVTPTITLTPTSGNGGTVDKVTGSGFAPTSGLTFSFTPSGGTSGTLTPSNCTPTTTTATGALPATPCEVTIPVTSTTGAGTVTVTDANHNTASATFTVNPSTGLGTMTVTPTTAITAATGKIFEFTFTAGTGGMTHGAVTLTIPTGWTPPSSSNSSTGYVTLTPKTAGTVTVTGMTIKVTGVTLSTGAGFTLLYGTGGGANGITVTSTLGTATFVTKEASTSTGTPATIAVQPTVDVVAACVPTTGTHALAAGATVHFVITGASGAAGGGAGGAGAGGTIVSGTLMNNGATSVTLDDTLGCEGLSGGVTSGGTGGPGYASGGTGGTGHSAQAGGGGGGGGSSALFLTVGGTQTVFVVAGGGGGGAGKNTSNARGGNPASPTTATASTSGPATGGNGTSPTNDRVGGTGGGGGGGGVAATAPGGATGAGGTGGTSYDQGTASGITVSNLRLTTGTSGATASVTYT